MNDPLRLLCTCGGEGRIVEVDAGTLAIGHINGGRAGHRFRLSRSAAVASSSSGQGSDGLRGQRRLSEASDTRAGVSPTDPALAPGRAVQSMLDRSSPSRSRVEPVPSPRTGSTAARSAGALSGRRGR